MPGAGFQPKAVGSTGGQVHEGRIAREAGVAGENLSLAEHVEEVRQFCLGVCSHTYRMQPGTDSFAASSS